jgi:hypothetical protein
MLPKLLEQHDLLRAALSRANATRDGIEKSKVCAEVVSDFFAQLTNHMHTERQAVTRVGDEALVEDYKTFTNQQLMLLVDIATSLQQKSSPLDDVLPKLTEMLSSHFSHPVHSALVKYQNQQLVA